ncbi:hypothetical protein [Clostridium sp. FS41]|uniref:hypothetical protein n=1 Tax=Clostridium sp. FS41 TaxID=1609975 RepID=UPI00061EB8BC|nr:hypothetical protein [Clostridium sp. FS41]KJJ69480.1 hypothetical protein CLFS41_38460 [Clostridium sp. FS41]
MIKKIGSIKKAIECECYLPALSLALTLPDICGQIEYPDFVNDEGDRQGARQYKTWYDNHVRPLYYINHEDAPAFQFDGALCYALRCALLHEGNFELKDRDKKLLIDGFRLHVDKVYGCPNIHYSYCEKDGKRFIDLDAFGLCFFICSAARTFYDNHEDKAIFEKYNSVVIDESWPDTAYDELFK